jgi:hypothetical protein
MLLMKYAYLLKTFFFHLLLMKYAYGSWMSFNINWTAFGTFI